jgi:peroxiredoxin
MTTTDNRDRRKALILTLFSIGIFVLGAALIPLLADAQETALSAGGPGLVSSTGNSPAPHISLTDLQGASASLDDYAGQVILVNNWATWCPPCKDEMPELEAYYQAHAGDGFVIVAIESGEPADVVEKFVQQHGLTFPVWLDPQGAALEAFQNWNLPSSYVIDRSGIVRLSWTGGVDRAALEKYVTPLLEK